MALKMLIKADPKPLPEVSPKLQEAAEASALDYAAILKGEYKKPVDK
jgi:hypothetical protein